MSCGGRDVNYIVILTRDIATHVTNLKEQEFGIIELAIFTVR